MLMSIIPMQLVRRLQRGIASCKVHLCTVQYTHIYAHSVCIKRASVEFFSFCIYWTSSSVVMSFTSKPIITWTQASSKNFFFSNSFPFRKHFIIVRKEKREQDAGCFLSSSFFFVHQLLFSVPTKRGIKIWMFGKGNHRCSFPVMTIKQDW